MKKLTWVMLHCFIRMVFLRFKNGMIFLFILIEGDPTAALPEGVTLRKRLLYTVLEVDGHLLIGLFLPFRQHSNENTTGDLSECKPNSRSN